MVTSKTESCTCVNCKCDPCECKGGACCGKSLACRSSWCNLGAALRIAIAVGLIVTAFALGARIGSHGQWDRDGYPRRGGMMMDHQADEMRQHCKDMPNMPMCGMKPASSTHDMMDMSMRDMGAMLEGKTGAELNKAFLTGMIPHHQGAIDMAKYLAASNKPELVKLGADIIAAQQKEIDQMNAWMKEWGYTQTGATNSGNTMSGMHMMPDGTMMNR